MSIPMPLTPEYLPLTPQAIVDAARSMTRYGDATEDAFQADDEFICKLIRDYTAQEDKELRRLLKNLVEAVECVDAYGSAANQEAIKFLKGHPHD